MPRPLAKHHIETQRQKGGDHREKNYKEHLASTFG
jgi:hypothetical protein